MAYKSSMKETPNSHVYSLSSGFPWLESSRTLELPKEEKNDGLSARMFITENAGADSQQESDGRGCYLAGG